MMNCRFNRDDWASSGEDEASGDEGQYEAYVPQTEGTWGQPPTDVTRSGVDAALERIDATLGRVDVELASERYAEAHCAICDDCRVPMLITANRYECPSCGMTTEAGQWDATMSGANGGSLRTGNGKTQGSLYITKSDPDKTKYSHLLSAMRAKWEAYDLMKGYKIPFDIIETAVTEFVAIKPNANTGGLRPKTHRRSCKHEILCVLIKFAGNRRWILHDKEIATFMGLDALGFSRGEHLVRTYASHGIGNLQALVTDGDIPYSAYLNRYFQVLGIDTPDHRGFVADLVDLSIELFIGADIRRSSKIVGAIWILSTKKKLGVTVAQLEACTGGVKKNTFVKFSNKVAAFKGAFAEVFETYQVPL